MSLALGDDAPDFTLPATGGDLTLSALEGKAVVLYFYPKDDTPGCTREAQAFSLEAGPFEKAGAVIIGISRDTLAKHEKFAGRYGLRLRLASDADSDVCERYGVWKEKNLYGRTYMGIERMTFLIDAKGRIAAIWPKVKVAGHADAVLAAVKAL